MKKRLLLACVAAMGLSSAFAYNVGDYIYTRNGKFKVIGANLIKGLDAVTTMGGTPLNPDSIATITSGADLEDGPNGGDPYLRVDMGNIKVNLSTIDEVLAKTTANFKLTAQVSSNTRYVACYQVKSADWSSASTQYYTGRNGNYQNIVFRSDTEISLDGATSLGIFNSYSKDQGWVERAYDMIINESGFLNFWFFNLPAGDCFGDFGVYAVEPVGDDRVAQALIDDINTYLAIPGLDKDAESRAVLTEEILPSLQDYIDRESSVADLNAFVKEMLAEDSPIQDFLDKNTVDLSKYLDNFTFNDLTAGTKRIASGWSSDISTSNLAIGAPADDASYLNFMSNYIYVDNAGNAALPIGDYTQSKELPKGKFLWTLRGQAYHHFINGTGSSSNRYIPDYDTPVEGLTCYINDKVENLAVPSDKVGTFIKVFDIAEDGLKTIGFHFPGYTTTTVDDNGNEVVTDITASLTGTGNLFNTSGSGRYFFDNIQLRMIGVDDNYVADYFYGASVSTALEELNAAIASAENDNASSVYVFGKDELTAAIAAAKEVAANNTASSEECLTALKNGLTELNTAVSAFKKINLEYVTLGNDIAVCKKELADEARPKGKDDFSAAINTAETYYLAQTATSRDSLMLVKTDSTLLDARMSYQLANASLTVPAEIVITNGSFSTKNATGWTVDGTTGNGAWKYQANSDFTDGYCAYYNRGCTAQDTKYIYQDVKMPQNGAYMFTAEIICRNYNMGSTAVEDAETEMYIFAGKDSTMIYTLPDPDVTYDSGGQTYPGNVTKFSQVAKIEDKDAEPYNGYLRIGIAPTNNDRTVYPNLIYIGSCHLYYLGSIEDFEAGIVTVGENVIPTKSDIYSINGVKVRSNATSLEGLAKGIYIMNGKKYVVK